MNRDNYLEGYVPVEGLEEDVLISGIANINRAIDSDIVVIELLPKEKWTKPSTILRIDESPSDVRPADGEALSGKEEEDEGENSNTNNNSNSNSDSKENENKRPSGKVVGIIKKNWKPYCGKIENRSANNNNNSSRANTNSVLFVAVDRKIPKIRIRTRQANELMGKRIVVCIDEWSRTSRYPRYIMISYINTV